MPLNSDTLVGKALKEYLKNERKVETATKDVLDADRRSH